MEWLMNGQQLQNTGSQLGMQVGGTYRVQDSCLETLGELLGKLSTEDRTLRTFRRALGFSQIIQKDLVPLLVYEKEDLKIVDAVVRLLVNLTIPVECLLPVEIMARTDAGRHTIFELNNLLAAAKAAFVDPRSTRSILQFMQRLLGTGEKLTLEECEGINNCLLLMRNILHIPELWPGPPAAPPACSKQNLIVWNLFAQGVDKVLIHLMTCPQKGFWSITMVQLIALTYKDQHVGTLQKLLNLWFEASHSESSDDNESNTSPPGQGSGDSSPMLTSDPTSDSSDNSSGSTNKGGSADGCTTPKHTQRAYAEHTKSANKMSAEISRKAQPTGSASGCSGARGKMAATPKPLQTHKKERAGHEQEQQTKPLVSAEQVEAGRSCSRHPHHGEGCSSGSSSGGCSPPSTSPAPPSPADSAASSSATSGVSSGTSGSAAPQTPAGSHGGGKRLQCSTQSSSELSDCGYATQVENQESMSTSSNEDEMPQNANGRGMKPVHQKPHSSTKHNRQHKTPAPSLQDKREWRRKKLVKRSRTNILNIKALMQHTPTDEDISNLLKEFTVDFLLKGYGALVQELHAQLLCELGTSVDTSHFFWLVTYFLKFAAQLELELENISPVLSYKIISYLTFEGVNLCEQLQLALLHHEMELKPCLRRLHLVVTAIREFIQAVDLYKKSNHLSDGDKEFLNQLQGQICQTGDLRQLFVLLLRHYNPLLQSKQYLQDLIATNHVLLLFLEQETAAPSHWVFDIEEHIKQFATAEMMQQYGRLLEGFRDNGKFVNDCIFTMMHHISGDINQVSTLFQPGILKTFSLVWEEDFEVCEDWSDLIEYVIHKFVNTPRRGHPMLPLCKGSLRAALEDAEAVADIKPPTEQNTCRWTKEECDSLYWYFVQSSQSNDSVGRIRELYLRNGATSKTRVGIIEQLYTQDIIPHAQYLELLKQETVGLHGGAVGIGSAEGTQGECSSGSSTPTVVASSPGGHLDDTDKSTSDDVASLIDLLLSESHAAQLQWLQSLLLECCYIKLNQCQQTEKQHPQHKTPIMEPVAYHYIMMRQSQPLVPWNLAQSTVLTHPPFVLLLHKLGFHLAADVGKLFPRIPHFWTAEVLYATAQKIAPINKAHLKFAPDQLQETVSVTACERETVITEELMSPKSPQSGLGVPETMQAGALATVRFAPLMQQGEEVMPCSPRSDSKELDCEISKMSISEDDSSSAPNSAGEDEHVPATVI